MKNLSNINGIYFWDNVEIMLRNQIAEYFKVEVNAILYKENHAWKLFQVEAPILTDPTNINKNYTDKDIFLTRYKDDFLCLRPETTAGSYLYALALLNSDKKIKLPIIVMQVGKSFRKEQDQVTKNMRLKEFYQQEFQCIYSSSSKNDYFEKILEPVRSMIEFSVGINCVLVESDRLPSYSENTMDVVAILEDRTMELCSISLRNDFNYPDSKVLEIAIGLDRCVYVKKVWREI